MTYSIIFVNVSINKLKLMDKSSITAINLSKQAKTRLFFLKYGMGASSVSQN
jgi:hypothetical protein